jgi:hypothetical protein
MDNVLPAAVGAWAHDYHIYLCMVRQVDVNPVIVLKISKWPAVDGGTLSGWFRDGPGH